MKAIDRVEWPNFLKPREFPVGVLDHMDNRVIDALIAVRTACGCPIVPSPLAGAHVRFTGSEGSRHYAKGRLSIATDFFCTDNSEAWEIWEAIKEVSSVRGFGIYFDKTYNHKMRIMFHIDTRKSVKRVQWLVTGYGEYVYLNEDTYERFYQLFAEHMEDL